MTHSKPAWRPAMSTLLLFEHQPPPQPVVSELAARAAHRGDIVVVCCLPMDADAYDIAHDWDEAIEAVRRAALTMGRTVECMIRFCSSSRVLPRRLKRGDIDLLVAAGPLSRGLSRRLAEASPFAGCRAWIIPGGSQGSVRP